MFPAITEDIPKEVGCCIEDLRLVGKIRSRRHITANFYTPHNFVQASQVCSYYAQGIPDGLTGVFLCVFQRYPFPEPPRAEQSSFPQREHAAEEEQIAGLNAGDVLAQGGRRLGEGDTEFLEFLFRRSHQFLL